MSNRETSYDVSDMRSLIRAGDQLNLTPAPGEDPLSFALRVADRLEDRRRRRALVVAARVAVGIALAAFGITTF